MNRLAHKIKFTIIVVLSTFFVSASIVAKPDEKGIEYGSFYKHRPDVVKEKIDELFDAAKNDVQSGWSQNGQSIYQMCGIDDEKFILHIISQSPDQKEFYFVDVGAGLYQWVDNVVKLLCNNPNVPKDKKYHIFGLNAEGKDDIISVGNCMVYKLGGFKTENIIEAFEERGIYLKDKIDFLVSQWTLRHLVDSLGAFLQMHQLMRSGGYMLVEGLIFHRIDVNGNDVYSDGINDSNLNVEHLLRGLGQSYLMCPTNACYGRGSRDVLIRKSQIEPNKKIGLYYSDDILDRGEGAGNVCRYVTKFITEDSTSLKSDYYTFAYYAYNGDQKLHDMLKDENLFYRFDNCGLDSRYCKNMRNYYRNLNFVSDFILSSDDESDFTEEL